MLAPKKTPFNHTAERDANGDQTIIAKGELCNGGKHKVLIFRDVDTFIPVFQEQRGAKEFYEMIDPAQGREPKKPTTITFYLDVEDKISNLFETFDIRQFRNQIQAAMTAFISANPTIFRTSVDPTALVLSYDRASMVLTGQVSCHVLFRGIQCTDMKATATLFALFRNFVEQAPGLTRTMLLFLNDSKKAIFDPKVYMTKKWFRLPDCIKTEPGDVEGLTKTKPPLLRNVDGVNDSIFGTQGPSIRDCFVMETTHKNPVLVVLPAGHGACPERLHSIKPYVRRVRPPPQAYTSMAEKLFADYCIKAAQHKNIGIGKDVKLEPVTNCTFVMRVRREDKQLCAFGRTHEHNHAYLFLGAGFSISYRCFSADCTYDIKSVSIRTLMRGDKLASDFGQLRFNPAVLSQIANYHRRRKEAIEAQQQFKPTEDDEEPEPVAPEAGDPDTDFLVRHQVDCWRMDYLLYINSFFRYIKKNNLVVEMSREYNSLTGTVRYKPHVIKKWQEWLTGPAKATLFYPQWTKKKSKDGEVTEIFEEKPMAFDCFMSGKKGSHITTDDWVCYDDLTFYPRTDETGLGVLPKDQEARDLQITKYHFNYFTGFDITVMDADAWADNKKNYTKLDADVHLFLYHMFTVICKSNAQVFKVIMMWFARKLQQPWKRHKWMPVFTGEYGCGKSGVFELMRRILGNHHCIIYKQLDALTAKFNQSLAGKVLTFFEESFFYKAVGQYNQFKGIMTQDFCIISEKYKNDVTVPDFNDYGAASNDEKHAIACDANDRRFGVFQCDPTPGLTRNTPETRKYFDDFFTISPYSIAWLLYHWDISDYVQGEIPYDRDAQLAIRYATTLMLTPVLCFWMDVVRGDVNEEAKLGIEQYGKPYFAQIMVHRRNLSNGEMGPLGEEKLPVPDECKEECTCIIDDKASNPNPPVRLAREGETFDDESMLTLRYSVNRNVLMMTSDRFFQIYYLPWQNINAKASTGACYSGGEFIARTHAQFKQFDMQFTKRQNHRGGAQALMNLPSHRSLKAAVHTRFGDHATGGALIPELTRYGNKKRPRALRSQDDPPRPRGRPRRATDAEPAPATVPTTAAPAATVVNITNNFVPTVAKPRPIFYDPLPSDAHARHFGSL